MASELTNLLYGAVVVGIAAGLIRLAEKWMGARMEESLEACKKLVRVADLVKSFMHSLDVGG